MGGGEWGLSDPPEPYLDPPMIKHNISNFPVWVMVS